MIIGESSRDETMEVNACKEKKLTNMRASGTDETVRLTPPPTHDPGGSHRVRTSRRAY